MHGKASVRTWPFQHWAFPHDGFTGEQTTGPMGRPALAIQIHLHALPSAPPMNSEQRYECNAGWQTHIQTADTCLKWIFKIYYTATRFKFRPSGKQYSLNVEMITFLYYSRMWKRFLNRMMWGPGEVRMEGRVRRVSYRMMFRTLCCS